MNWIKVLFFNFLIFFALIGLTFLAPPAAVSLYRTFQTIPFHDSVALPNYENVPWIKRYLLEYAQLNTRYEDYVVWRTDNFSGEQINVQSGLRATTGSISKSNTEAWFFGGSTMWGVGVNDQNTIPSIYTQKTGIKSINYGEKGHMARQSLAQLHNNYLININQDKSHRLVVFYDGVNDVVNLCRIQSSPLGSNQEAIIRAKNSTEIFSYKQTFKQLTYFVSNLTHKIATNRGKFIRTHDCDTNPNKAATIALRLVATWEEASKVAERQGDDFLAILQPVAFQGSPNTSYLKKFDANNSLVRDQFNTLYPLIRQHALRSGINFIDLTSVYDSCEFCYIDFCHVSHNANHIIVNSILESPQSQKLNHGRNKKNNLY